VGKLDHPKCCFGERVGEGVTFPFHPSLGEGNLMSKDDSALLPRVTSTCSTGG
jgi:hypothetical protein